MSEAENYLNKQKLTPEGKYFFLKQNLLRGSIEFEEMINFFKETISDWSQLSEIEKLKHFLRLWTIEAELTCILAGEKDGHSNMSTCYRNGRTRSIADTEEIIHKLEKKEI
jgi:hypothetical protein